MSKYCFGVDVGGTTVKLGLFDLEGNVQDKWEIITRTEENGKNILPDVAKSVLDKMAEKNIAKDEVAGIGIGVPGPAVQAGNDANVAALGEMWRGGGQGFGNMVLVTLGTGVGGGVILGGKILTGATGAAGEIGHIHIEDKEGDACGCGNHGCLEQYASATGIVRLAKRRLEADTKDSVLRQGEVSAKTVFDAVKAGDEVACEIAEQFGQYLGKGLAAIAAVVNPEAFVIGGGVSKAGDILCQYITKYYEKYAFHGCMNAQFKLATLGNDAGIYGAAKLVL